MVNAAVTLSGTIESIRLGAGRRFNSGGSRSSTQHRVRTRPKRGPVARTGGGGGFWRWHSPATSHFQAGESSRRWHLVEDCVVPAVEHGSDSGLASRCGVGRRLRLAIVVWIEKTCHRRRRQAALGRLTPIEFETIYSAAQAA